MLGERLADLGPARRRRLTAPTTSRSRRRCCRSTASPGADALLGPEMRSTGEVMGVGARLPDRVRQGPGRGGRATCPRRGTVFLTVTDSDKPAVGVIAAQLHDLGFSIVATRRHGAARSRAWASRSSGSTRSRRARRTSSTGSSAATSTSSSTRRRAPPRARTATRSGARRSRAAIAVHHDDLRRHGRRAGDRRGAHAATPRGALAAGDPPRASGARRRGRRERGDRDARAARAPAARRWSARRALGAYVVLSRAPTRTGRRPTRASSTCSPPPSAGAGARTSARSCRARSPSRARHADGALDFVLEDVGPGTRAAGRAARRATDVWLLGPLGRGFAPPRDGAPAGARRRRRRDRAAGDLAATRSGDGADAARLPRRRARRGRGADRAARGSPPTTARSATTAWSPSCSRAELGATRAPRSTPAARRRCSRRCGRCAPSTTCPAQLALESGMACGFGACFGCVVPTRDGYVRLCVDGPVLDAARRLAEVGSTWPSSTSAASRWRTRSSTPRGRSTRSPPGARSATRCSSDFPFAAFVSKTVTLAPRQGNPPPRLWELGAGMINSIGLPNKGLEGYLAHDLPELAALPVPLIVNVMGSSAEEVATLVHAVRRARRGRRARAQRLLPEREDRAADGRRPGGDRGAARRASARSPASR